MPPRQRRPVPRSWADAMAKEARLCDRRLRHSGTAVRWYPWVVTALRWPRKAVAILNTIACRLVCPSPRPFQIIAPQKQSSWRVSTSHRPGQTCPRPAGQWSSPQLEEGRQVKGARVSWSRPMTPQARQWVLLPFRNIVKKLLCVTFALALVPLPQRLPRVSSIAPVTVPLLLRLQQVSTIARVRTMPLPTRLPRAPKRKLEDRSQVH